MLGDILSKWVRRHVDINAYILKFKWYKCNEDNKWKRKQWPAQWNKSKGEEEKTENVQERIVVLHI